MQLSGAKYEKKFPESANTRPLRGFSYLLRGFRIRNLNKAKAVLNHGLNAISVKVSALSDL
jgi:hypothetical protein